MPFYLDELASDRLAEAARSKGVDIVSSHECGRDGLPDETQLLLAAEDGRCFVTQNYPDFIALTFEFQRLGLPHAGVLLLPRSLKRSNTGLLGTALQSYPANHPDGLPYAVDYLAVGRQTG